MTTDTPMSGLTNDLPPGATIVSADKVTGRKDGDVR